jgi:predicted nucleic acid-binding protein
VRAFFDSNILDYALTAGADPRRATALRLIKQHLAAGSLVLSTQVLMETWNVLTRKKGAAPADALASLRLMARGEVLAPGAAAVLRTMELAVAHRLSSWDALIVQAALEGGCDTLFTEDLQSGRRFGTLEVVNPFTLQAQGPATLRAPRPKAAAKARGARSRR